MKVGIIGGGFYWKHWGIAHKEIRQNTPYGEMSDSICYGLVGNHEAYSLQRHGIAHHIAPHEIPWKANVYGMWLQRPDFIIHVTACGALNDAYLPGDIVLFDQILDFTKNRPVTLGAPALQGVTHLDFSHPLSENLLQYAHELFIKKEVPHWFRGTVVAEEGPRFSSIAELKMYQMLGADIINQTSCPEVYFCRELAIPVLALSLITNKIDLKRPILAHEISENIAKFKAIMPKAIHLLIEALDQSIELENLDTEAYDTSILDIRANI